MPVPEISGLLVAVSQAAKTATSILKVIKDVEARQQIIELQTAILDLLDRVRSAQTEYDQLAKSKGEVEAQLQACQQWDSEAARYQLLELVDGIFVYALKPEYKGSEPPHYLCPHCFSEKKRSILQRPGADYTNFVCHACKLDIRPKPTPVPFVSRPRYRPRMLEG